MILLFQELIPRTYSKCITPRTLFQAPSYKSTVV